MTLSKLSPESGEILERIFKSFDKLSSISLEEQQNVLSIIEAEVVCLETRINGHQNL